MSEAYTQEKVISKIEKLLRHQQSAEKIGSKEEAPWRGGDLY